MGVHSIAWVGNGRAFDVNPKTPSLGLQERMFLERAAALKEVFNGAKDLPDDVRAELREQAECVAGLRSMNVLIHGVLCGIDPAIKRMTPHEVQEKLTADEYVALMDDLKPKTPEESDPLANATP